MPVLQYKFVKDTNSGYTKTGKASLKFQIINQRADFSFVLFSGGLSKVGSLLYCPLVFESSPSSGFIDDSFLFLAFVERNIGIVGVLLNMKEFLA